MKAATTAGVKKAFRENILARFGVPKILITDNETQFTSHLFRQFVNELEITHQTTAPYSPQGNPTERANRTIKTMIAQSTEIEQRRWDEALPEIMVAINSSISTSTGFTPAYVVQGREPRLPRNLYDEVTLGIGKKSESPDSKARRLIEICGIAKRNMVRAAQDQSRHYNLRRREWKPELCELVLTKTHPLSKAQEGFAAKIAQKFIAPFEIIDFTSPLITKLREISTDKIVTSHVSQLKRYQV
ncbi:uncharacterized protein LOC119666095 [Teleopsis dalmanni]|uniref:uncharacterized protein LOC119666095 n=1 Tax=Teleopsis dalmanni TaxID=139649 RepID=UPI0018CDC165|nr:uncharacterized protein LOC119666095 [Teleopsis dalmanni]